MKQRIRSSATDDIDHQIRVPDVPPHVLNEDISDVGRLEVVGVARWFERATRNVGAEPVQPEG